MTRLSPQAEWLGVVVAALCRRGNELAERGGHVLDTWSPAKKKLGAHAMKATCLGCGKTVIILPLGDARAEHGLIAVRPGIRGDALDGNCTTPILR